MTIDKHNITLLFAGDFIPPGNDTLLFSEALQGLLHDKDFSLVNLEAPLTDRGIKADKAGRNFRCMPAAVQHLKYGSFDAVALANNHIRDWGDDGVLDTLSTCREHGIMTVGAGADSVAAGHPLRLQRNGWKITILNYCEKEFNIAGEHHAGANPFDIIDAARQIKKEKESQDLVMVVYHGGVEYIKYPSPYIKKYFQYLIEAGADAVIAHHTHFYSGMILHHGKPLIFSLGNLYAPTGWRNPDRAMFVGLIAKVTIDAAGTIRAALIPTLQDPDKMTVSLPEELQQSAIEQDITRISETIEEDHKLHKIWDAYYRKETPKLINQLTSASRLAYRIKKQLPFFNRISRYKTNVLLNMLRCDAHRYKSVEMLERMNKKKLQ